MSDMETLEKLYKAAQDIALRWMNAPEGVYYSWISNLSFDFNSKTMSFNPILSTPGIQFTHTVSLKYLEDDSTLEEDSIKWYENDCKLRRECLEKERQLRENPFVQEFLKNQNIVAGPYGGLFRNQPITFNPNLISNYSISDFPQTIVTC